MGYCTQATPEMADFSLEVRNESFVINSGNESAKPFVYPDPYPSGSHGSVEFNIRDIPALRAVLDQAERVASGNKLPTD